MVLAVTTSGALSLAACGVANADEILDFNPYTGATYGSNLATTPNIALDWTAGGTQTGGGNGTGGWEDYGTWNGRSEPIQADFNVEGDSVLEMIMTPDAGFGVFVSSFELDEWAGGGDTSLTWELVEAGLSGTWDVFNNVNDPGDGGGRTLINTGMTSSNAVFGQLTFRLTQNGGAGNYVAMDNFAFGQAVPEPASGVVLVCGLGGLLMRRKRK